MTNYVKELDDYLSKIRHELINRRAHEIWVKNGKKEGFANKDWRQAEIEIDGELGKVEQSLAKTYYKKLGGFLKKNNV